MSSTYSNGFASLAEQPSRSQKNRFTTDLLPVARTRTEGLQARTTLFVATDLFGIWTGGLIAISCMTNSVQHASLARRAWTDSKSIAVLLLFSILAVLINQAQNAYLVYQAVQVREEFLTTCKSVLIAYLVMAGFLMITFLQSTSERALLVTAVCSMVFMTSWRVARRQMIQHRAADGVTCHNVLIVGTNGLARQVADYLRAHRHLGLLVSGFVSCHGGTRKQHEVGAGEILGDAENISKICQSNFIDEILICEPESVHVPDVVTRAMACRVGVRFIPNVYPFISEGGKVDYLGEFPTLAIHQRETAVLQLKCKRVLDIVVAMLALVLLSPLFALLAIAVALDSDGPVFYQSKRVGRKGQTFSCYKFRTMVPNAEQMKQSLQHLNERDSVLFKIKSDPRITRIGKVLRKYSLDELPQLVNVLQGDMSLVGPRPPLASEVMRYQLAYLRRLEVTPGITGLWQVKARGSDSFEQYLTHDFDYIENWNLGLDLKILYQTIRVVITGTGA